MTIAFKVLLKLMLILLMNARINLFSQDRSLHAVLDVTLLAVENEIQTKLLEKVGPLIRGLFRSVIGGFILFSVKTLLGVPVIMKIISTKQLFTKLMVKNSLIVKKRLYISDQKVTKKEVTFHGGT